MDITYGSYLKIPELLSLQQVVSNPPEHDEFLFIVIHQVYELWFRQQLHEGDRLCALLHEGSFERARGTLARMLKILKTMVAQIDVLETMSPVSFLQFREFLTSASGFQSWQFRAFEMMLGQKNAKAVERYPAGSAERAELERRLHAPSVWTSFAQGLAKQGHTVPPSTLHRDPAMPPAADPAMQAILLPIYRQIGPIHAFCESLVDLDEGVQEWRYRHVKMVERTIGSKPGTGGSAGVQYLKSTLFQPLFPDLWELRSAL
ncbi:MAG: tryptophan 2,3-dioxygenase [Phycisphaerales bacterium]